MTGEHRASCVLIDDHEMVRRAVRLQLAALPWLAILGEASTGDDGLALLTDLRPDLAVVDVRMPGMDGMEVARAARDAGLPTRILLLSAFASPGVIAAADAAGATACVSKSAPPGVLLETVVRVAALETVGTPRS